MSEFELVGVPSVIPRFLEVCPSFQQRWNEHLAYWAGKPAGDYLDIAELAHHVVESYAGDRSCLPAIFQLTEELLRAGHPKQKEIIAAGLLEAVQTIASHQDFGPDAFLSYLGPLSRDVWDQIERAWQGKSSLADVVRSERHREKPPEV
jgi:hypothetical protein